MKRFLSRFLRIFVSQTFLLICLGFAILIILFYAEEDWRGSRAWAQTKAQWEARGESFDAARLIPPPIPNAENLAATPLFAIDPATGEAANLQRAFDCYPKGGDDPKLGLDRDGHLYDPAQATRLIAAKYAVVFHQPPPPGITPLQQFEAIYPFLGDLRAAAAVRPRCRFAMDYTSQPPYGRSFRLITSQLRLAKILSLHASLALQQGQPDLALSDLNLIYRLSTATAQEPTLVSNLVAIGMNAIARGAIAHGLALHQWNDAQLADLQQDLASIDNLAQFQFSMRAELNCFSLPTLDYFQRQRPPIRNLFADGENEPDFFRIIAVFKFLPNGWLALNEVQSTNLLLTAVTYVDASAHRVDVVRAETAFRQVNGTAKNGSSPAPWNIFAALSAGPILGGALTFARGQVDLDETRIACALERHRLRHGVYPATLAELVPDNIPALPHDVIDGQPYRYLLRPDGTYLLYSIGWNQKDDGGQYVRNLPEPIADGDSPKKHGDWVWPR